MNALQDKAAIDKTKERTRNSVLRQLAMLQSMSLEQLRDKWLDLYGAEPPQYKKQFLIKRLAYRIQELFYGGLSESAKAHLRQGRFERSRGDRQTAYPRRAQDQRHDPARHATGADLERPEIRGCRAIGGF